MTRPRRERRRAASSRTATAGQSESKPEAARAFFAADASSGSGAASDPEVIVARLRDPRALAAARGLRLHGDVVDVLAELLADLVGAGELEGASENHGDARPAKRKSARR